MKSSLVSLGPLQAFHYKINNYLKKEYSQILDLLQSKILHLKSLLKIIS